LSDEVLHSLKTSSAPLNEVNWMLLTHRCRYQKIMDIEDDGVVGRLFEKTLCRY